jgi:O-succinylbenzoic acid--CoA ligase
VVPRLVVVPAEGDLSFVDALRRAWDSGDAVLPLDPRLPPPAARAVLEAARVDEPVEPGDALVVATSGTGGAPRAAVLTSDAVAASAAATSARLGVDPAVDRWLACIPLAHVGGLGVVSRALLTGTALTVLPRPDPTAVAEVAAAGPTLVSLVPTALDRLDPGWFKAVVLGGAADPGPRPANVVRTYGLTETGGGVVYDGEPLDGVEVRVVGGEVHLRSPTSLRAYRDGTDPKDHEGWLPTGDSGTLDPDGRLVVAGRLADVVVTGGEKVWPDDVEPVLAAHPGVRDVAVIGRPDPEWGAVVVAVVVPADPADPPSLESLRELVKESRPAYAAPRRLELVDTLPRTALGKVRRASLR